MWWRMVSEYWPTDGDASWAPWNKDLMWRLLVETGVILHNLLRIRFPAIANAEVDREDEDHNIIPGAWRETNRWRRYPSPGTQQSVGKVMRDYVKAYFNSEAGSFPWQERLAGINVN